MTWDLLWLSHYALWESEEWLRKPEGTAEWVQLINNELSAFMCGGQGNGLYTAGFCEHALFNVELRLRKGEHLVED